MFTTSPYWEKMVMTSPSVRSRERPPAKMYAESERVVSESL